MYCIYMCKFIKFIVHKILKSEFQFFQFDCMWKVRRRLDLLKPSRWLNKRPPLSTWSLTHPLAESYFSMQTPLWTTHELLPDNMTLFTFWASERLHFVKVTVCTWNWLNYSIDNHLTKRIEAPSKSSIVWCTFLNPECFSVWTCLDPLSSLIFPQIS